ncbi:MAG: hypothetical protein ACXV3V_10950 [Actinomycetes bacterium]
MTLTSEHGEQLELGEALRDEGCAQVNANTAEAWREQVDAAIRSLAALGRPFTADDVRDLDGINDPPSPNAWGSRFLTAAKRGVIVRVGYLPSRRASVHAHPVAVWQGTGA